MNRRVVLLLPVASLVVSLSVAFAWRIAPAAAAAERRTTAFMTTEAWYSEPPPCVSLIDCSAAPAPSPYPKDTLHVSMAGGRETARTYLAFAVPSAPGTELFGGVLTLPVDTAAADGSLTPDQATIQACPVTAPFKPVRGSTQKPPAANCHVTSAATYDKKTAAFTIDLTPFVSTWHGGSAELAIVPSKAAAQPGATWHVVFHATTKPDKTAPPITVGFVTYTAPSSSPPKPAGGSTQPSGGGGSFGSTTSTGGSFSSSFPQPSFTSTTTTTTTTSQTPTGLQPAPPTSLEGFAGPGFAYPAVWALPLLLLAGIGAIGRALTKELYRRGI